MVTSSRKFKSFAGIISSFIVIFMLLGNVSAATYRSFTLTYEVDMQSARDQLQLINEWRTSGTATYKNTSNVDVSCGVLKAYTYDYALEQIALQRAYEIAVSFDHTRPDGTAWNTCTYNGVKSNGENIAAGSYGISADRAFVIWQENNDDYSGQGHRRAMLSSSFTAIGIAHVSYGGYDYWVQEFGTKNSNAAATTAVTGTKTGTVRIDTSTADFKIYADSSFYSMVYGQTKELPGISGYYQPVEFYGSRGIMVPSNELTNLNWQSSDTSVLTVVNNKSVSAVGTGTCKLTASVTFGGKTYSYVNNVTVYAKSIGDSEITCTVPGVIRFDPEGVTPKPVITWGNKTLVEGTDYTITGYSNNKYVTNGAYINISGKGNYSGSRYITFEILKRDINDCTMNALQSVNYTGGAIVPQITLTLNGTTLKKNTHYTVACVDNTNPGTATVTVTGMGSFEGERTATFTITKQPASNLTFADIADQQYTGSEIIPNPVIKNGTRTLVKGTDYTVSYSDNTEIGTATATVTMTGNYTGSKKMTFKIVPRQISSLYCFVSNKTYTGSALTQNVTLRNGSQVLVEGTDYTVSYSNNVNVGTATMTLTGIGNYAGSKDYNFNINPVNASLVSCTTDSTYTYNGSAIIPNVTVKYGNIVFKENVDYTLTFTNNVEPGSAEINITGISNILTGTATKHFTIYGISVNNLTIGSIPDQVYTGSEITPKVVVRDGSTVLKEGTDYTLTYYNNTAISSSARVTITCKGHYRGSISCYFKIIGKPITDATVSSVSAQTYTGSAIKPSVTVKYGTTQLVKDTDYTVSYSANVNAGTASIFIYGKGIYSGTKTVEFTINPKSISSVTASFTGRYEYSGYAQKPYPTVKDGSVTLSSPYDFTLSYANNVNAGTATATLTGCGNYTGSKKIDFTIEPDPGSLTVSTIASQTYTGSAIKPAITVSCYGVVLKDGTDYEATYTNNVNKGTATVSVQGIGNYSGTGSRTFTIAARSLSGTVISSIADKVYTGTAITPAVTVKDGSKTLVSGTDYTVSYSNNINVGTATVTVTGKGNYSGTKTATFKIVANTASFTIASISAQTYTGTAITPAVTVKDGSKTLISGTDYTVSYSNNINVGTATVTVTGKGNYSGTATAEFTIKAKAVSGLTYSSIADQSYTGSAIKPAITVKDGSKTLVSGTDYTVSYSNNINVGTATVTVTGKGNYSGSVKKNFSIIEEVITYTWKQVSGKWYYVGSNGVNATGFAEVDGNVYYFNDSGVMLTKWQEIGSDWYYFASSGEMKTGWQKISKVWYYFDDDGKMVTGLNVIDGILYFFKSSGAMATGWQQVGSDWYYFASSGAGKTGWQQISKVWYYFAADGKMATGLKIIDGKGYYFKDSGAMVAKKWIELDGDWYWFKSDGAMAASETVTLSGKAYKFDANGVCLNP